MNIHSSTYSSHTSKDNVAECLVLRFTIMIGKANRAENRLASHVYLLCHNSCSGRMYKDAPRSVKEDKSSEKLSMCINSSKSEDINFSAVVLKDS